MLKKSKFAASMMCANYLNLEEEVTNLQKAKIDYFHIDIMDGRFVPNFAMSINDLKCIASISRVPLDVHLMVEHPSNTIDLFTKYLRPNDIVYIHPEAEYHPSTTLKKIFDAGLIPGLAVNPGTSVEYIYEMLNVVKNVLIMTVNPGNAGQMYLPFVERKIKKLVDLKAEYGLELFWDGACGEDKIQKYAPLGIDGFVLGTTVLFGKNRSYFDIMKEIRDLS